MKGGPTSASTGSPLARPTLNPGTPRFVWFIALLAGPTRAYQTTMTSLSSTFQPLAVDSTANRLTPPQPDQVD